MTVAIMANTGEIAQIFLNGACEDVLMREALALASGHLRQFYYHEIKINKNKNKFFNFNY